MLALRVAIDKALIITDESTGQELGYIRVLNCGTTRAQLGVELPAHFSLVREEATEEQRRGIREKARAAVEVSR